LLGEAKVWQKALVGNKDIEDTDITRQEKIRISQAMLQAQYMRKKLRSFAIVRIGKDITPQCRPRRALVNMHRAFPAPAASGLAMHTAINPCLARLHAAYSLNRKAWIGDQQRITRGQSLNLELVYAISWHKGIARIPSAAIGLQFLEEGPQPVVGADAERRIGPASRRPSSPTEG